MSRLEIDREFLSPPEGVQRTVRVWLPDAYDSNSARRFPVLYLHDGQNLFAHPDSALPQTWEVDVAMQGLIDEGLDPWIVVAIDHRGVHRLSDYSPWDSPAEGVQGLGPRYAAFLTDHLKPQMDRSLRTRPEPQWTAVGGSSLGGLISLHLGLTRPDVFGRVAALSPSVMWADRRLFAEWTTHVPLRIYLDAGAREQIVREGRTYDYGGSTRAFSEHLRKLGYGSKNLKAVFERGGAHSEVDWRRRLPGALRWLLARR
ncbi:MAG TPA: alpha/beta hydrolase-fold protein [Myxococcales bacterium]|jgi:predicted alpha/beta superfamily hydrolase